jgi:hypothetical protein
MAGQETTNLEASTMNPTSIREVEAEALARGFDLALERQWDPSTLVADHGHPFAVKALMVCGEKWLTVGSETRHLQAGG